MERKVVIVTGSRNWCNQRIIYEALSNYAPDLVVQGGAKGADAIAKRWAAEGKIPCETFHAEWGVYGRAAGHLRNGLMLDSHPGAMVFAFPLGGPGTADCIRQAVKRGHIVRQYGPRAYK